LWTPKHCRQREPPSKQSEQSSGTVSLRCRHSPHDLEARVGGSAAARHRAAATYFVLESWL
jgi:hypothetical protein